MDSWYKFSVEMKPVLEKGMEQRKMETEEVDRKQVYFVSVEDSQDE